MRILISLLILAAWTGCSQPQQGIVVAPPSPSSQTPETQKEEEKQKEEDPDSKYYLVPSETVWGNPKVTAQAIKKVREAGFTTIRIPVTWLRKIGPAPTYTIDSEWMARVTEAVDVLLRGWFSEDPAYTLDSVYNAAPYYF